VGERVQTEEPRLRGSGYWQQTVAQTGPKESTDAPGREQGSKARRRRKGLLIANSNFQLQWHHPFPHAWILSQWKSTGNYLPTHLKTLLSILGRAYRHGPVLYVLFTRILTSPVHPVYLAHRETAILCHIADRFTGTVGDASTGFIP
jgi:hypothetical protein